MARIGVICDREFFHPFDQRVYKEALTLLKAGHMVEILTPHPHTETRQVEGLTVHCVSTKGPPGVTALRLLRLAVKGQYDLYHCHELDPLLYSLLLRPLTRKPVVWDCHEYYGPMVRGLRGPLAGVVAELGLAVAAPRVEGRVTVDRRLARRLAAWGPVTVLPNYPRAANFPSLPRQIPQGPPRLIYVGGMTPARGCRVMLRALRRLRERLQARLVVVGGFYDDAEEDWARAYDDRYGLEVEWRGWVDHRELAPVLAGAQVGLSLLQPLPRYQRAVPTKLYEYMLAGLPVLASWAPPVARLLAGARCGLTVDATDPEAVARGMEALLTHPQPEAMGRRGCALVRNRFTWEAQEAQLVALYRRVLAEA